MSWPERSVHHHKRQTDRAISRAYARLATDSLAAIKFHELLHCSRERAAGLLQAPVNHGYHPGVEALIHLSRFNSCHIRPASKWSGSMSFWRSAVSSLAHHLICKYEVPLFLSSAWYATDSIADRKRGWFMEHGRGSSFRSLDLPIVMTRKMEHIFLASHDHLTVEHAIRRAELLALGAPTSFLHAVLSSSLTTDLSHIDFWRKVWLFLITNRENIDPGQIGPMIDYLLAVRQGHVPVDAPDGVVRLPSPQSSFSMKGRTVQSMLRLVEAWH